MGILSGGNSQTLVIDTSSNDLKLAVGTYNKNGNIYIDKAGIVPLEADAIADGAISDSFGVIMAIKHAFARLDVRNKNCIITTDGAFVHTRDLELPKVKADQLDDMVRYEVMGQGTNKDMNIEYIVYGQTKDIETNADKLQIRGSYTPEQSFREHRFTG